MEPRDDSNADNDNESLDVVNTYTDIKALTSPARESLTAINSMLRHALLQ